MMDNNLSREHRILEKTALSYKIRCYDQLGNLDHEEFFDSLDEAKKRRTEWGLSIGLRPEPSSDFSKYPTIWELKDSDYQRIMGF